MRIVGSRRIGITLPIVVAALISATPAAADLGQVTPQGCFEDAGVPATGCTPAENQGLAGAHAIAISPDGRSVYASGLNDDAVSMFSRDPATGVLTPRGCISDADAFPAVGCADFEEGMKEPFGIAVSPDGLSVYVTGRDDDSIARLDRDPGTGDLTGAGCIGNTGDIAGCGGLTQAGLIDPAGVVVSPDGEAVYVVGRHAVTAE